MWSRPSLGAFPALIVTVFAAAIIVVGIFVLKVKSFFLGTEFSASSASFLVTLTVLTSIEVIKTLVEQALDSLITVLPIVTRVILTSFRVKVERGWPGLIFTPSLHSLSPV